MFSCTLPANGEQTKTIGQSVHPKNKTLGRPNDSEGTSKFNSIGISCMIPFFQMNGERLPAPRLIFLLLFHDLACHGIERRRHFNKLIQIDGVATDVFRILFHLRGEAGNSCDFWFGQRTFNAELRL